MSTQDKVHITAIDEHKTKQKHNISNAEKTTK